MAKIYLDSCMIIGLIEGDIAQRRALKNQLIHHTVHSSELARLETRLLAVRTDNQDSLKLFDHFFAACEMVELNRAIFEQATHLRANSQLKTPDALHLAAAMQAECEEFWTNDKQLVSVSGKTFKNHGLGSIGRFTMSRLTESAIGKIKINSLQIQILETLRDTLLPKLMSGEVRVGL